MGSAQSFISSEAAVTAIVLAGAIGLGYKQIASTPTQTPNSSGSAASVGEGHGSAAKKGKKKKQVKGSVSGDISDSLSASNSQDVPQPRVVAFPEVIPGQFDAAPIPFLPGEASEPSSKGKKSKKKAKGKAPPPPSTPEVVVPQNAGTAVEQGSDSSATLSKSKRKQQARQQQGQSTQATPSSSQLSRPLQQSTASLDTDGSWTRVGSRRRAADADSSAPSAEADPATSDAGITSSVTGNSTPAHARKESTSTEDESFLLNVNTTSRSSGENRRTLAEKLLPKPRKTGVDDMLETSDFPTLSRVMRVKPLPDEQPATGFSWGDYEDVRVTDGGENDADGEDDGWDVVTSKRPKRTSTFAASTIVANTSKDPESLTKKQRQNAKLREKEKAKKAAEEADRLARLADHKRTLEKERILEQYSKKSSGKAPSGGMKATVDEQGKLVWE